MYKFHVLTWIHTSIFSVSMFCTVHCVSSSMLVSLVYIAHLCRTTCWLHWGEIANPWRCPHCLPQSTSLTVLYSTGRRRSASWYPWWHLSQHLEQHTHGLQCPLVTWKAMSIPYITQPHKASKPDKVMYWVLVLGRWDHNWNTSNKKVASFPGLSHFCSLVCIWYKTQKQKSSERWEGPEKLMWMTSGGHQVDVGGGGWCPTTNTNLRVSLFRSSKVLAIVCEHLGYYLVTEHLMKFSMSFERRPLPPTSTLCPPDIIHAVSASLLYIALPVPCAWMQTEEMGMAWERD